MNKTNEYVYDIEEYSQDTRHYQLVSNVKLTHDEVRNIYQESDDDNTVEIPANITMIIGKDKPIMQIK